MAQDTVQLFDVKSSLLIPGIFECPCTSSLYFCVIGKLLLNTSGLTDIKAGMK